MRGARAHPSPRATASVSAPAAAARAWWPRRMAGWFLDAAAMGVAVLWLGLHPLTWRRPARDEAARFAGIACLEALPTVAIAAMLVGGAVVAQALFWFARTGAEDVIPEAIGVVVLREVAPLVVGLLVVGRGGLIMIGELGGMVDGGLIHEMERRGIDPFALLVLPRTVALMLAMFVLTVLFTVVSLTTGYFVASALDLVATRPQAFVTALLVGLGTHGALIIPLKAGAIGLAVGVTCTLTAWRAAAPGGHGSRRIATGFIRATLAVLLVNTAVSLAV